MNALAILSDKNRSYTIRAAALVVLWLQCCGLLLGSSISWVASFCGFYLLLEYFGMGYTTLPGEALAGLSAIPFSVCLWTLIEAIEGAKGHTFTWEFCWRQSPVGCIANVYSLLRGRGTNLILQL